MTCCLADIGTLVLAQTGLNSKKSKNPYKFKKSCQDSYKGPITFESSSACFEAAASKKFEDSESTRGNNTAISLFRTNRKIVESWSTFEVEHRVEEAPVVVDLVTASDCIYHEEVVDLLMEAVCKLFYPDKHSKYIAKHAIFAFELRSCAVTEHFLRTCYTYFRVQYLKKPIGFRTDHNLCLISLSPLRNMPSGLNL